MKQMVETPCLTRRYYTPPLSSVASSLSRFQKHLDRSIRTVCSNLYNSECINNCFFASTQQSPPTQDLTNYVIDVHLLQLATTSANSKSTSSDDFLGLSQVFNDFSAYSSDISGELQCLATLPEDSDPNQDQKSSRGLRIESVAPEGLQPTIKICVNSLGSSSVTVKRSVAVKLWLLEKNRSDSSNIYMVEMTSL